jgi:hypothetical protein
VIHAACCARRIVPWPGHVLISERAVLPTNLAVSLQQPGLRPRHTTDSWEHVWWDYLHWRRYAIPFLSGIGRSIPC